jgi:hypothetical protein
MKTRISIALFAVLLTGGAAAEAKTVDRPNPGAAILRVFRLNWTKAWM